MFFQNLIYRSKYKFAKYLKLKSPVDVTLELSSFCNQKCSYCYHAEKELRFERKTMELSTAKRILNQAKLYGVSSVKFNWRGESTLNPNFLQITDYAKRLNFIDRISNSNFNFASDRTDVFKAFANQTKVKISFDTFDKKIFEFQRRGANYDRIFENINKFHNNYLHDGCEMVLQMVKTNLNQHEDLAGTAKKIWPNAKISIRNCVANRTEGAKDFSNEISIKRKPCYQAFARLIFNTEGSATCCCPDISKKFSFGNILENDLIVIWNNYKLKELQKQLKSGEAFKYDPCKNCSSLESYEGYKHSWTS